MVSSTANLGAFEVRAGVLFGCGSAALGILVRCTRFSKLVVQSTQRAQRRIIRSISEMQPFVPRVVRDSCTMYKILEVSSTERPAGQRSPIARSWAMPPGARADMKAISVGWAIQ